jgi:hypothetical protein
LFCPISFAQLRQTFIPLYTNGIAVAAYFPPHISIPLSDIFYQPRFSFALRTVTLPHFTRLPYFIKGIEECL